MSYMGLCETRLVPVNHWARLTLPPFVGRSSRVPSSDWPSQFGLTTPAPDSPLRIAVRVSYTSGMIRSFASALLTTTAVVWAGPRTGAGVPEFWVRPGYSVSVAAENFGEARFLELDARGTLYLSQPSVGKILAMRDQNADGVYETSTEFVMGMNTVHGMHFVVGESPETGWLWFTTSGGIYKAQDKDADGKADEVITVVDGLISGGGHWWRSICVTPAGIFTSIGDSGNINDETDSDRQKIWKYSLDGKSRTLFASGIRNNEKLRLRPGTSELWGCDHGSDNFGKPFGEGKPRGNQPITDLYPPCEFNLYTEGGFYGHPFIVGDRIPRQEFKDRADIVELAGRTIPPAYKGGAHWANNGWCFATQNHFADHAGDAFIAYHGSWNSSTPVGYQVHRVLFDKVTGQPMGGMTIVSTLKQNEASPNEKPEILGRPCDVIEAADGTLLFTCTKTRRVYRISKE